MKENVAEKGEKGSEISHKLRSTVCRCQYYYYFHL